MVPVADGRPAPDGLSQLLHTHGVDFTLVHGGLGEVRGRPLGSVTLELRGETDAVEAVVAGLTVADRVEAGAR
ncbi:NIL domain-containing protein [Streptomyces sp. NPDC085639]|uniref:NIL domain-containing protein n=1 Tax=Streptomyces sp. NPDC085639 TaxID=3365734 RepID=UPI0037D36352